MSERLPVIIVMGVSSSGKSTVGRILAQKLNIPFADADDYHPESNLKKMEAGKALNDEDRYSWLIDLNHILRKAGNSGMVMACSALKEKYRQIMSKEVTSELIWVYLDGSYDEILERMKMRKEHFMPSSLLKSQFKTMEEPEYALKFSISDPAEVIVDKIILQIKRP